MPGKKKCFIIIKQNFDCKKFIFKFWSKVTWNFVLRCYILQLPVSGTFHSQRSLHNFLQASLQTSLSCWFSCTANNRRPKFILVSFGDWSFSGVSPLKIQTTILKNFYHLYVCMDKFVAGFLQTPVRNLPYIVPTGFGSWRQSIRLAFFTWDAFSTTAVLAPLGTRLLNPSSAISKLDHISYLFNLSFHSCAFQLMTILHYVLL